MKYATYVMYRDRRMIKLTQTVFQRVEKKYLLTEKQYHQVMAALKPYMNIDEYGLHTIGNVYYDTKEDTLIEILLKNLLIKKN